MRGAFPRVVISYSHGDWVMKDTLRGRRNYEYSTGEWKASCIKLSSPVGASR